MTEPPALPPEQWAATSRLLDEALALDAGARATWLAALGEREPALAPLIARLLAAHELPSRIDPLSAGVPARLLAQALGGPGAALEPGAMVGPYRLVRALGAGGMATVWLAEQTASVLRQVALKIPHASLETKGAAAERFARERDLLATLEHEHIARLYDAGITAEGVPFLAMELIDGVPITEYCDRHRLDLAARVALFRQVLEAVGLAHTRLVIHRDLKPSNILVTSAGQVKLLDFGIANLLSDPAAPIPTAASEALTPDTASPEQLAGRALGTASDVYSLGVLLFELLTGHKPYALARGSSSLHAALMATPVGRPSEAEITETGAAARGMRPHRLRRALRGELDAIVGKSLAREPAARYPNVEALTAELERFARREPVEAVDGGIGYRLRCFAVRRRWSIGVSAALLAVVLIGAGATLWQARAATEEAHRAEAIESFLLSLFRGNTPSATEGHELTARELLARGSARIGSDLRLQPLAQAELHSELGDIYGEMGDDMEALKQLDLALAGFAALGRSDSHDGLEALFRHGTALLDQAQWDRARADLEQVLERGLKAFGPRHRWAVGAREKLAFIELENDRNDAALAIARAALAQPVGEDAANDALRRLRARVIVGEAETNLGDFSAARATLTQAVAEAEGPAGYGIVDRLVYRLLLARVMHYAGDEVAAEQASAGIVADEERVLGRGHPLMYPARELRSQALAGVGRYTEAVDVQRENLARALGEAKPNAQRIAGERWLLAQHLARGARYVEAEPLVREALGFFASAPAAPTAIAARVRRTLGEVLIGLGRLADGTHEIEQAVAEGRRVGGFGATPDWAGMIDSLAAARRLAADFRGALDLLVESCTIFDRRLGPNAPIARRCAAERAWLGALLAPGDSAARRAFDQAAGAYAAVLPPGHVARAELGLIAGELAGGPPGAELLAARATLGADAYTRIVFLH